MLIEFRCTNLSNFDAAKGRYIECDELIVASDDNIGKLVKCPKCDQMVEVPMDYVGVESANRARRGDRPKPSQRPPARKKRDLQADGLVGQGIASPKIIKPSEEEASLGSADLFGDNIQGQVKDGSQTVHDVKRKRCPSCGSLLDDHGKCSLCNYVEPQFRSKTASLDDIKIKLAGFQLWISEIVSEGASFSLLALVATSLLTVAYLLLGALTLLLGEVLWFVAITCLYVVYILSVFKAWQLTRNPRARLSFWQRPCWNGVLFAARLLGWHRYDSRYAGRKIINLRNAPIVDERVAYIEDLDKCQVLDLQNTLITDKGLLPLYGLNNLHCLIVRRTAVTPEGVFRLQQANPRLWIWD